MKRLLIAVLLTPAVVLAQVQVGSRSDRALMGGYLLTSTSLIYCSLSDPPRSGPARLATSGSSTTVTRYDSTSEPFTGLVVGDQINPSGQSQPPATVGGNPLTRYITVIGSTHSVTVNSAVDLSAAGGYAWTYRTYGDANGTTQCATTINAGWVPLPVGTNTVTITVSSQSGVTTLTYSIETLSRGGGPFEGPTQQLTGTMTTFSAVISGGPVASQSFPIGEDASMIRVGVKVNAGSARVNVILGNGGQ